MQVDEAMHEGIVAARREQRREIKIVYSVGSIYVEYYDLVEPAWVTAQTIDSIPANSELTYGIGPTMACGGNVTSLPFATSMASSRMVFNVPYGMNVSPLSS